MTGPDNTPDDINLEALFDEVRAAKPVPSSDLMARIASDAASVRPVARSPELKKVGAFAQILDALGGWPTIAGLVTATVTGVYIGFVQPELVIDGISVSEDGAFESADLWPDDAMFFEEG